MSLTQLPTLEVHLEGEMVVFAFHLVPKAAYRANIGDRRNLLLDSIYSLDPSKSVMMPSRQDTSQSQWLGELVAGTGSFLSSQHSVRIRAEDRLVEHSGGLCILRIYIEIAI